MPDSTRKETASSAEGDKKAPVENGRPKQSGSESHSPGTTQDEIEELESLRSDLRTLIEEVRGERTEKEEAENDLDELKEEVRETLKALKEEGDRVEELRKDLEKDKEALTQHAANQIKDVAEEQKEELEGIAEEFNRPLENVRLAIADDFEEGIEKIESQVKEVSSKHKRIATASGQLIHTAEEVEEGIDVLQKQAQRFSELSEELGTVVDQMNGLSKKLDRSTLQDSLELLENKAREFHNTLEEETEGLQNEMIQQVENRFRRVVNRFEAMRKKTAKKIESVDQQLLQRLEEMQTIRDAFKEYEQKANEYHDTVQALADDANRITVQEAFLIGAIVFSACMLAGIVLNGIGVL